MKLMSFSTFTRIMRLIINQIDINLFDLKSKVCKTTIY